MYIAHENILTISPVFQGSPARRVNTWTDFSSSDPLYALKGEVATASLVDDAGAVDDVKMAQYLEA